VKSPFWIERWRQPEREGAVASRDHVVGLEAPDEAAGLEPLDAWLGPEPLDEVAVLE
jgi:hypothetical protein